MAEVNASIFGSDRLRQIFTLVKYVTYALLSLNVYLFLQEELLALDHTFAGGIEPGQIIQSFAASIDTGAWVILLLLFELETAVVDDSRLHGGVKWLLHGVRGVCYIAVAYAFSGYYAELTTLYHLVPLSGLDPCSLIAQNFSLLVDLDEYVPLDTTNCAAMGAEVLRLDGFNIIVGNATLRSAQYLAWVDLFNSAAWIGVVIVLEIEVRMQLRGKFSQRIMAVNKVVKLALYTVLFVAAAYWGYAGDFLDFWDAALWLFAFIFIELNVFEWQHETSQTSDGASA